jgi:hypothetical protein
LPVLRAGNGGGQWAGGVTLLAQPPEATTVPRQAIYAWPDVQAPSPVTYTAPAATGGMTFAGSATWSRTRASVTSGGLTFAGTGAWSRTKAATASGGSQFAGAATTSRLKVYGYTPSGGIQSGGTGLWSRIRTATIAAAGYVFGGIAATFRVSGTQPLPIENKQPRVGLRMGLR